MSIVPAGKCALITGSNAGLGFAIAQALAGAGCNIVLNGIVPEQEGSAARDALARSSGAAVIYEQADIADLHRSNGSSPPPPRASAASTSW